MMRPGIWNKVAIEEARSRHEPRLTIKPRGRQSLGSRSHECDIIDG